MKSSQHFMVFLALFFILFVVGCTRQQGFIDPYQGTLGVVARFASGMPPHEVYEQEQFQIGVELENKGAANAEGFVSLVTENDLVKPQVDHQSFVLKGKTTYNPYGEKTLLFFPLQVGSVEDFTNIRAVNLIALVCYSYQTHFSTQVCIDPHPYDQNPHKPCRQQTVTGSGTGAPLAIVKVEPRMSYYTNDYGEKVNVPEFVIYLKKTTQEQIINPYRLDQICGSSQLQKGDIGSVFIVDAKLGNRELVCEPNPVIITQSMDENYEGSLVRCKYQGEVSEQEGAHLSPLTVTLRYGVMQRLSKQITIKNLN